MKVNFGVESLQILKPDAMWKVQIFSNLAKLQMYRNPFHCLCLLLFGAKNQNQLVDEAN